MSHADKFHDYIRDVPLEIGRRFFPPPLIRLPAVQLPCLNEFKLDYSFEAEMRARKAYEDKDKVPERPANSSESSNASTPTPSTSSQSTTTSNTSTLSNGGMVWSNEVLQPMKGTVAPQRKRVEESNPVPANSFDDFENRAGANVFDELEWKAIDDRAALSEVLGSISLATASTTSITPASHAPNPSAISMSTTNGIVSFTRSTPPPLPGTPGTPGLQTIGFPVAPTTIGAQTQGIWNGASQSLPPVPPIIAQQTPLRTAQNAELRARLLTKGYRENIVNIVLERLPKDKLPLIEFYMKGMRTMEKVNVDPAETLDFLLGCQLTDKQKVVDHAAVAAQLVSMGFEGKQCFQATRQSSGDRVAALDLLLSGAVR